MIDVVLFWIQWSGKGTQAALINEKLDGELSYFSSGDIFRALLRSPNPIWEYVDTRIKNWELIDDRITQSLFRAYAYTAIDEQKWMLLDGYPRSISQLDDLLEIQKTNNRKLVWIWFEVPDEQVKARMRLRGREDDTEQWIKNRLEQFYSHTVPVIEYFQKHADLISINADDTIENIHLNTMDALKPYL